MAKKTEEKTEQKKEIYEVVEVPSQYTNVIKNNTTEEEYDILAAMAKIMSDLEEIKSSIVG